MPLKCLKIYILDSFICKFCYVYIVCIHYVCAICYFIGQFLYNYFQNCCWWTKYSIIQMHEGYLTDCRYKISNFVIRIDFVANLLSLVKILMILSNNIGSEFYVCMAMWCIDIASSWNDWLTLIDLYFRMLVLFLYLNSDRVFLVAWRWFFVCFNAPAVMWWCCSSCVCTKKKRSLIFVQTNKLFKAELKHEQKYI